MIAGLWITIHGLWSRRELDKNRESKTAGPRKSYNLIRTLNAQNEFKHQISAVQQESQTMMLRLG